MVMEVGISLIIYCRNFPKRREFMLISCLTVHSFVFECLNGVFLSGD